MPSPTTVLSVITKAMLHLGAIASGETPNADEASDGLDAFNDVLETWSTQKLAVYGSEVDTFNTVAGTSTYTMGTGGTWGTVRPVQNITEAYCRVQGVDFPIGIWTQPEYDAVPLKAMQQQIVERLLYINDFPLGKVVLWPVPSAVVPVSINFATVLTNATAVGQAISYPPGYARALAYAVAVELAPQYGGAIDVSAQARSTMAYIKRANRVPNVARFDPTLSGGGVPYPARGY